MMRQRNEKTSTLLMIVMFVLSKQVSVVTAFEDEMKIQFSVYEEEPESFKVGNIIQQLNNASIRPVNFLLIKSSHSSLFSLDQDTSDLSILQRIDREVTCEGVDGGLSERNECSLTLQVVCEVPPKKFVVVIVKVVIRDVNDNAPIFPSESVSIRVAENLQVGSKFLIPSAQDADSETFNIDYYTIQNCEDCRFSLERESSHESINSELFIRSEDAISRRMNPIKFDVVAVDRGNPSKSGRMGVVVYIDETNQAPRFEEAVYQVTVLEERMFSQPLVRVKAIDTDTGNNGKIEYSLAKASVHGHIIEINSNTGDVYLTNKLDYEVKNYYRMEISAKDMGTPPFSATTVLIIRVEDANDHSPKLTLTSEKNGDSQFIGVSENMREAQTIAFISVSDDDQGRNANVSCHISTHEDLFALTRIHLNVYSISTLQSLDRESNPFYTLEVVCRDMGDPPLETSYDFNVNVSDQNDNHPIFTEHLYISEVFENSPKGTYLLDVAAVDLDIGLNGEIRYFIEDSLFHRDVLLIDEKTGIITTGHRSLDFESNSTLNFRVEARDLGFPPLSTFVSVNINILDTNDNPPVFKNLFNTLHVSEDVSPRSVLHIFESSDNDKTDIYRETAYGLSCCNKSGKSCKVLKEIPSDFGQNQERGRFLEYYMENQLLSLVTMEGDTLYASNFFDREVESVYHFCVHATNTHSPHLSSIAYVTLEVDDVNDNPPTTIFPAPSYTLELSSWTTPDEVVIQIIARDPDAGENSRLKFFLSNNVNLPSPQSFFFVNETNGMVSLTTLLRETDYWNDTSFVLNYTVSDSGSPVLSTHGFFTVMIFADENKALFKAKKTSTLLQTPLGTPYNLFILLILCASTLLLIAILSTTICLIRSHGRRKRTRRKDGLDELVEDECKINPSQVFLVDVSNDLYSHHNSNNNNNNNINNNNNNSNNNDNVSGSDYPNSISNKNSITLTTFKNENDEYDDGDLIINRNINTKNNNSHNNVYFINGNTNNSNIQHKNIERFETSPYNPKRLSYNQPCQKPTFANFSLNIQHPGKEQPLVHDSSPSSDSGKGQSELEVSDSLKHPSINAINNRYGRYNGELLIINKHHNPSNNYIRGANNNNPYGSNMSNIYNKSNNCNNYNNQYPSNNYNMSQINNHKQFVYGQERKELPYGYCSFQNDRISEVSGTPPAIVSPEDPSCVETFI